MIVGKGLSWMIVKGISWIAVLVTAIATGLFTLLLLERSAVATTVGQRYTVALLSAIAALIFYPVVKAYSLGQIQTWVNALFALSCVFWGVKSTNIGGALHRFHLLAEAAVQPIPGVGIGPGTMGVSGGLGGRICALPDRVLGPLWDFK